MTQIRICKECRKAVVRGKDFPYECPVCENDLREEDTELVETKDIPEPYTNVAVPLIGTDGNAFALLGKVRQALRRAGYSTEFIENFTADATAGNYDDLLQCIMRYVEVE